MNCDYIPADIDGIVAHLCKVLGRLAADAEREYRS